MLEIHPTSAIQNILLAIKKVNAAIAIKEARLSSGLKVGSAQDDPVSFFISRSLSDRAALLLTRKDDMAVGATTLEAAHTGVSAITDLIDTLRELAFTAQATDNKDTREAFSKQFNTLLEQINRFVGDATVAGINLISPSPGTLSIVLNEDGSSKLVVPGIALDKDALAVGPAENDWKKNEDVDLALQDLDSALQMLHAAEDYFTNFSRLLEIRLDFTTNLASNLEEGAMKLVSADLTQESAELIALSARRDLAIHILSLAGKAEAAIIQFLK